MKIYLREITENETELNLTQDEKWVKEAVLRCDERLEGDIPPRVAAKDRPIQVHMGIRQVDNIVVVSGNIDASVQLVCSRCANHFMFETHPHFSALYSRDPVMAGVDQNKGFARHAHDESLDDEESSESNTEIVHLNQDFLDLADVVSEQIQVQIPFQPLCKESCKGVCQTCGADLNAGRCACAKIVKQNAFTALRDFKARS